ncbi:MAG: cellulose synthase operon protein YhjQ/BcsQ [Pirellulales bacterium]
MSHLDRLFIRALSDSSTPAVPAEPVPAVPTKPLQATPATANPVRPDLMVTHAGSEELYVGRTPNRSTSSAAPSATNAQTASSTATRELYVATPTPPEEIDVKQIRTPSQASSTPQPVWEVDCYQWPAICRRLESQLDESLQQLARRILSLCETGGKAIGITSCRSGEGRSSLLLALARQLAWLSGSLAVLDGDWQHPELASLLQVELDQGWELALAGKAPWQETAVRSLREQMVLFPWRGSQSPARTDRARLHELVAELVRCYRLLLVDAGPTGRSLHEIVPCDHMILVRDCRRTSDDDLQATIEKLEFAGVHVLGIVENFAELGTASMSASRAA